MFNRFKFPKIKKPQILKSLALGLVIMAIPTAVAAWGPSRQTYDYNKFDPSKPCTDPANANGRCGSTTGPVFNSFTNAPAYGDERDFVTIAEATPGDNPIGKTYVDEATAQPGKEYWVRIYVHNNANHGLNCSPEHRTLNNNTECTQLDPGSPGIATGTRVKLAFDPGRANGHDVKAVIGANNASEVWDESVLRNNNQLFRLDYVPGSAKVLTNKQSTVLQPLSDEIASANGVGLGMDFGGTANTSGNLPGCFEFAARVYVKVVVKAPLIKVEKKAYISGTQTVIDNQTVAPNTQITYKVRFFNIGNDVANDLTIRDTLPAGVNFVKDTIKFYTNEQNGIVQTQDNVFFNQGGFNLGNYAPLTEQEKATNVDNGLLTYRVTIKDEPNVCELVNVVFARAKDVNEVSSTSKVLIDRNGNLPGNGCQPTTPPVTPPVTPAATTPTTLPKTGPASVLGIFGATSVAGTVLHRLYSIRRAARGL